MTPFRLVYSYQNTKYISNKLLFKWGIKYFLNYMLKLL
jgi:hypothetical protein